MFRLSVCLFVFVLCWGGLGGAPKAQAQGFPCSSGVFSMAATVYIGAPNVVFLLGNAIRLGRRPSKVWGVTGIVTGTIASVAQLMAMFGDTSPFCGDPVAPIAFNSVMLAIHVATFALGVANTVKVDLKRANAPPKKRKKAPKKIKRRKRLSCKQVFALYEGSLRDAPHAEDKALILKTLLRLEKTYFPCFFTKPKGRRLRRKRRRLLGKSAARKSTSLPPAGAGQARSFSEKWRF